MLAELLIRFVVGGVIVSLFATVGSAWKPKTLAGTFAAAPSVALVALGIAYAQKSRAYVGTEAQSMLLGSIAFIAYSAVCIPVAKTRRMPIWLGAIMSWGIWLLVAALLAGTSFVLGAQS